MYVITDVVEVGHDKFCGGTIDLKINIPDFFNVETGKYIGMSEQIIQKIRDIFDSLDHSLITINPKVTEFCQRYHLLDEHGENLFIDIFKVIYAQLIQIPEFMETLKLFTNTCTLCVMRGKEGMWFNLTPNNEER